MSESASVPKAVLYYGDNVWSNAVLLALEEKGYASDEVDRKIVDLAKGENFSVSFLRLNLKGTCPTLVVPFKDTLSDEVESRYKAVTDPKAIIDLLDQSRSSLSRTRTTSTAPAPALRPATIAFTATSNQLLEIVYAEDLSPEVLKFINARDGPSLKVLATNVVPVLAGRQKALAACLSDAEAGTIQASEKVKTFWRGRLGETEGLLAVLLAAEKEAAALDATDKSKREDFFAKAKGAWEVKLKEALVKLNQEFIGPYALGDQLSIADLSLAAWLREVVILAGGAAGDDGAKATGKLETHIGGGFVLAKTFEVPDGKGATSKLAAFWDAMSSRPSWKKV